MCINLAPIADAGPFLAALHRTDVTLDGSNSYDPDGTIVSYRWVQSYGPTVTLGGSNTAIASFIAPRLSRKTSSIRLSFTLYVEDNGGRQAVDSVAVSVYR